MVDPLKIVLNFSRFKPALNWNLFLGDLRRGLNSLNSDTEHSFEMLEFVIDLVKEGTKTS